MFSKESFVFISGILLLIVPFLGIPQEWRVIITVALALLLVFIGYALRRRLYLSDIELQSGERATNSFVETTEKLFDERALK